MLEIIKANKSKYRFCLIRYKEVDADSKRCSTDMIVKQKKRKKKGGGKTGEYGVIGLETIEVEKLASPAQLSMSYLYI